MNTETLQKDPAFTTLPEEARADVRRKLRAVGWIVSTWAMRAEKLEDIVKRAGASIGLAPGTMRKYYDNFRHSQGDWTTLLDVRMAPLWGKEERASLPGWLIDLWKRLCEENQRKVAPAHRRLIRMWQAGEPEGYTWPNYNPATKFPMGCSLGNLRNHKPTRIELTAMRDGLGAAMGEYGPMFLSTRVGLYVGSHYLIDDVLRDMKLLMLGGGGKIVRPQEFGVLDLLSGHRFAVHRRPYFKRADGTTDGVKEFEMRFLAANVFRNVGFSPRGTQIVMEAGTATIRAALAKWLFENSGGKISTRGPGTTGREQAIAGWVGSGGGNPRHKAALESHHNLLHNEAAFLPAATGHDRNPPEWLFGVERQTESLLKALRTLPPAVAAGLRAEMLEYWQGLACLRRIDEWIGEARDHELEGWVDCGHVRVDFCRDLIGDVWVTPEEFCALDGHAQQKLQAAAEAHPAFRRVVQLSRREVFTAGSGALERVPDHAWAMFFTDRELGDDLRSKPKRLNANGDIELDDKGAAPGTLFFRREIACPGGGSRRLAEGEKFATVLNPFDTAQLWIYGERGDFLGTAPRKDRVSPLDERGIEIELGHRSHEKAVLLAPLRERHAGTERLIAEMQGELAEAQRGVLSVEQRAAARAEEKRIARNAGDIADFLPAEEAGEGPAEPVDFGVPMPSPERPALADAHDFLPQPFNP